MKKKSLTTCVMFLTLLIFSTAIYPWGSAIHVYIADHLGKDSNYLNLNEMYGSMGPDLFNYMFTDPNLQELYISTHYDCLKMWPLAHGKLGKALALGFISHNDAWGADFTAHHHGVVSGTNEGYVIEKAKLLLTLAPAPEFLPPEQALELYHSLVESALDILVKRLDENIGQKITRAALMRSFQFPRMMKKTYISDFAPLYGGYKEAARMIVTAENNFRKDMISYGQAISQDESTAVQLLAQQMVDMAEGFLGAPLPIPEDEALELVKSLIAGAMQICEPDYQYEISATISQVAQYLKNNGINY